MLGEHRAGLLVAGADGQGSGGPADAVAEAEVMGLIVAAFADHLLHFPLGAQQQEQRDVPCPFGRVAAWYLKYESADRTSIHGHGSVCQPDLQPEALSQLLRSPATAARIFTFVEQLSQQYLPSRTGVGHGGGGG